MAKTVNKTVTYTGKGNRFRGPKKVNKQIFKDNTVMTGKQQYKLQKQRLANQNAAFKQKQTTIRAASANLSQAIAGATGSVITGQMQTEQTKRARIESAAKQATQGGLTSTDDSREEDEEEETTKPNPWAYGKRR